MEIRVNPTRMELNRLKKRLQMALRGHKLLKDKRDELIRQFLLRVRKNKELREQIEKELTEAFAKFLLARAVMSAEALEEALMYPTARIDLKVEKQNIMSVYAPRFLWEEDHSGSDEEAVFTLMVLQALQQNWIPQLIPYQGSCPNCWSWPNWKSLSRF